MKKIISIIFAANVINAYAAVPANVESQIHRMLPNTKISQINAGPWDGTYEILAGGNAFYTGIGNESEVIVGHIVNIKTMADITQAHIEALNANNYDFKKLPAQYALKVGSGKKKLAVFIDPDCPYCQQLEAYLSTKMKKLTIYYYFLPLAMHPNALPHTKQILCSKDPENAIGDVMIAKQELPLGSTDCQAKVEKQLNEISKFSAEKGINSTPFMITDTNQVIGGFNLPELQKFIEGK